MADDLSGAADCAAATGTDAVVMLAGRADTGARVVALDIDSRDLSSATAAARSTAALAAVPRGNALVYQKLDSTLRGNWPFELDALSAGLSVERGEAPLAVLCPAFPERGRTMVSGMVRVDGEPVVTGSIVALLAQAGRPARIVGCGSRAVLQQALAAAATSGDFAVCDALSRAHLDDIAAVSMKYANVVWAGSAGLMRSLASQLHWPSLGPRLPAASGCVLVVVGSASPVSRRQVERLAAEADVEHVLAPAQLLAHPDRVEMDRLAVEIETAAHRAKCVVISIGPTATPVAGDVLVSGLAQILVPLLGHFGSMVLTGGETARSLLVGAGVDAVRIQGEVEPGVPLGWTVGALERPIVTKAGGFGTADTLIEAVRALAVAPREERTTS